MTVIHVQRMTVIKRNDYTTSRYPCHGGTVKTNNSQGVQDATMKIHQEVWPRILQFDRCIRNSRISENVQERIFWQGKGPRILTRPFDDSSHSSAQFPVKVSEENLDRYRMDDKPSSSAAPRKMKFTPKIPLQKRPKHVRLN